jgi:hypothetical protein
LRSRCHYVVAGSPVHPVGTLMAIADRAGDILASRWG